MHSSISLCASLRDTKLDRAHLLIGVDDEFGLRRIEIEAAAAATRGLAQRAIDLDQRQQRFAAASRRARARAAGSPRNSAACAMRIGQPRRRAHHRRIETALRSDAARR